MLLQSIMGCDARYTISQEMYNHFKCSYVIRFCGRFMAVQDTYEKAVAIAKIIANVKERKGVANG